MMYYRYLRQLTTLLPFILHLPRWFMHPPPHHPRVSSAACTCLDALLIQNTASSLSVFLLPLLFPSLSFSASLSFSCELLTLERVAAMLWEILWRDPHGKAQRTPASSHVSVPFWKHIHQPHSSFQMRPQLWLSHWTQPPEKSKSRAPVKPCLHSWCTGTMR